MPIYINDMPSILEIRALELKPGSGVDFDRLYRDRSLPLLREWSFDIVRFGASLHSADRYYVLRAFNDLAHRECAEDAFYASEAWRNGPRETILGMVASYADTVIALHPETLDLLRTGTAAPARTLEMRAYKLKPGAGPEFERLFREEAGPMVRAYGMDVVAFGQSQHDADCWHLIRAFDDLAHLAKSEDEFYGAPAWRDGPREAVLAQIESYNDTVLTLSAETIERLRADLAR